MRTAREISASAVSATTPPVPIPLGTPAGAGWAPGVALDPSRTGWVPGRVYVEPPAVAPAALPPPRHPRALRVRGRGRLYRKEDKSVGKEGFCKGGSAGLRVRDRSYGRA